MNRNIKKIIRKEKVERNFEAFDLKKLCLVLKANAYGLGVENFTQYMGKVHSVAVNNIEEALDIRKLNKSVEVIVLAKVFSEDICLAVENDITVMLDSVEEIREILLYLKNHKNSKKLKVHIKANIGMNRLGVSSAGEFDKMKRLISKNKNWCLLEGVHAHFNNPLNEKYSFKQKILYNKIKKNAKNLPSFLGGSLAKGYLEENEILRAGIEIFRGVLEIRVRALRYRKVKKGESVSYGEYIADKDMYIALLGVGYADGLFRRYSEKGEVILGGKRCRIIGNICMDMMMVEVSGETYKKNALWGTLLGREGKEEIKVEEMAEKCETIDYEIYTSFSQLRCEEGKF